MATCCLARWGRVRDWKDKDENSRRFRDWISTMVADVLEELVVEAGKGLEV